METDARRILWHGAGCPLPREYDGTPAPHVEIDVRCATCGISTEGRAYEYGAVFSENFLTTKKTDQLMGYAEGAARFCVACAWSVRCLALRCAPWVARESGVWFVAQRDLLAALLDPPAPPFVVGWPRKGVAQGGEAHAWRCQWDGALSVEILHSGVWWSATGDDRPLTTLPRLNAKHVAIYAETAWSAERYPLQIDSEVRVMVDVPLWRELTARLAVLARSIRDEGVPVAPTRECLRRLRPPRRASAALLARWPCLTRGLAPHVHTLAWDALTALVPIP